MSNPSVSDKESYLKWLDGSAYNKSVTGLKGDMGSYCHQLRLGNSPGTLNNNDFACNETRSIVCQYDCSNINEGMVKLAKWRVPQGPSIYDIRTEEGRGVRELVDFADEEY